MKHSFPVSSLYRLIIILVKNELKVNQIYERYFCIDAVQNWTIFCNRRSDEKVNNTNDNCNCWSINYFVSVIVYIITVGTFADRLGIFIILVLLYF